MNPIQPIAAFLIAVCAISAGATEQNVYRCGSTYSQKPCADSVVVDVQDARTSEQKAESDASIKRDSAAANAMEKSRLKEEAQQRADNAKFAAALTKKSPAKPKSGLTDGATSTRKTKAKKKPANRKKEPDYFTTRTPTAKPKKAASASK